LLMVEMALIKVILIREYIGAIHTQVLKRHPAIVKELSNFD